MTKTQMFKNVFSTAIVFGALTIAAGAAQAQQARELFNNTNIYGVLNGTMGQPTFTLNTATQITEISTYHWNNGYGAQPGSLFLRNANGQQWGPFAARGSSGQGNAANVNWTVTPGVSVPAGTYMVFDSSPNTWSQNPQSQGRGFTKVYGYAVSAPSPSPAPAPAPRPVAPTTPAYGFTPCAANSNPVAVVGPCVVARGGTLFVYEVRAGITPARLQFLANTPYSTAYNVIVTLSRSNGNLFTMTVPPQLCGPGSKTPGFGYNVFMLDANGVRQGQIGQFTPDCR